MKILTIVYRNDYHGGDGNQQYALPLLYNMVCPICGGERGEPKKHTIRVACKDIEVDAWDNPCGHVDNYKDLYFEAFDNGLNEHLKTAHRHISARM